MVKNAKRENWHIKNCSIFQNTHKCWIKMMRTTPVSIWKLYSMACWDDDEHQQQQQRKIQYQKKTSIYIMSFFFALSLVYSSSAMINIILKSISLVHSGKKVSKHIHNILSQRSTILLSIFFFSAKHKQFFSQYFFTPCWSPFNILTHTWALFIRHLFDY